MNPISSINSRIFVEWKGDDKCGAWMATCPDLNLEVAADNIEDAIKGLQTAVASDTPQNYNGRLDPLSGNPKGV